MGKKRYFKSDLCASLVIGGMLVPSVLKSNLIAQHVITDGHQNGGGPGGKRKVPPMNGGGTLID